MKKSEKQNRALQKSVLFISLVFIAVGIYLIFRVGFISFIELGTQTNAPPSTRRQPFFILFMIALAVAFFTARNLLRRK